MGRHKPAPDTGRPQLVNAKAGTGRQQPRPRLGDGLPFDAMPADIGLLDDILGRSNLAEHAVGETQQDRAVRLELGTGGGPGRSTPKLASIRPACPVIVRASPSPLTRQWRLS